MRVLAVVGLIVFASCAPAEPQPPGQPGPEHQAARPVIEIKRDESMQPSPWDFAPEPNVAKTIDWFPASTAEGAGYLGGAVVIDKIFRQDAEDIFTVDVRLKNTQDQPLSGEYRIEFFDKQGTRLLGLKRDWEPFVIEPLGLKVVSNTSIVKGAIGFKVFVRAKGGTGEGEPDLAPVPKQSAPQPGPEPKPTEETRPGEPPRQPPASGPATCPRCGFAVPAEYKFCGKCGTPVRE